MCLTLTLTLGAAVSHITQEPFCFVFLLQLTLYCHVCGHLIITPMCLLNILLQMKSLLSSYKTLHSSEFECNCRDIALVSHVSVSEIRH